MELVSILQFLEKNTILVTGATGFLAKVFVEKILRAQPNVKKLYLLLRATDSKSATQRLNAEILAVDLFRVLKDKLGSDFYPLSKRVLIPIAGDVTHENLGVMDSNMLEEMWREVDIVVNLAATTNFDERYDISLALNTFGVKHVYNFAKKCSKLKLLLHVSTAYVSGEKGGLIIELTLNELTNVKATNDQITQTMKDLGIERARTYGWPNTYVFTKAMGEMLLGQLKQNMPLVIIRPTIITSTYKESFPGWIQGIRTIDSLAVAYGKGRLTCFLGDPNSTIDLIPGDMVVNAMIVAMVAQANQFNGGEIIYHVGSSDANPLKYSEIQEYGQNYFRQFPWINKEGKPVQVGNVTILSSMSSFNTYMAIHYMLPLKGLQLVNAGLCQLLQRTYLDLNRKVKSVFRYDDSNTEKLRQEAAHHCNEKNMFGFDPRCINWEDYFINTHLPGAVKYVFK